jgi:MbtH protein
MSQDNQAESLYEVVLNDEEQYSIWPIGKAIPLGWKTEGTQGPKDVCLARIKEVWTDMRPLSLRKQMASLSN